MKKKELNIKAIEWVLRLGVFGVFFGHGVVAINQNPQWLPLLTQFGFSVDSALSLMQIIGFADVVLAFSILVFPMRIVLIWMVFWAFATALARPLAGFPIWAFVERTANWATPLALLILYRLPKSYKALFKSN